MENINSASSGHYRERSEIRWGILGCGDVCEVKSGPGFQKAKRSRLVAVMRRDASKAADFAARHKVGFSTGDAMELIHHPQVDAVYVATPPGSHEELALAALAAGKPVYVEKPMARTGAECDRMNAAAANAGLPLYVAYYRRMLPAFLKVRGWLEDNAIGTPTQLRMAYRSRPSAQKGVENPSWRTRPEISGGGLLHDLGSHALDLLDYFFGPARVVEATGGNHAGAYEPPDWHRATLAFPDGLIGDVEWDFAADQHEDSVVIEGSHGTIRYSVFSGSNPILETKDERVEAECPAPPHVQQALIQTVVDDLMGTGHCPSTGKSGARTSHVMDAIQAAAL